MKMGPKGQVVIPKAYREKMGVHPGEQVEVVEPDANGETRVKRAPSKAEILDGLQGIFAGTPGGMKDIEEEHRRELEREERKLREWNG